MSGKFGGSRGKDGCERGFGGFGGPGGSGRRRGMGGHGRSGFGGPDEMDRRGRGGFATVHASNSMRPPLPPRDHLLLR